METVPRITDKVRLPLEIPLRPFLMDHRFEERAVLPAVEAVQVLSASTQDYLPELNIRSIENAHFSRFLYLPSNASPIAAINEIQGGKDGRVISSLLTRTRSKSGITRTHTHVSIEFPPLPSDPSPLPADQVFALEGIGMNVPSDAVYRSLVPFGPAFQNIQDPLVVTRDGAITLVHAPEHGARAAPLGSPFPLDAAFHAACVWGQRYRNMVGFPMGFELRRVFRPTGAGGTYVARVAPKSSEPGAPVFDIWLYGLDGLLYEAVQGVIMQDVSRGRMKPPPWILPQGPEHQPGPLSPHCDALCVMELASVSPTATKALSPKELARYHGLGKGRRRSFLGARLCLKHLSRQLSNSDMVTPAAAITTIASDQVRPVCPLTDKSESFFCSVSHDKRFVIAVAAKFRVGVDVEALTERVFKARHLYMHTREKVLADRSPLGKIGASLRIWSIKEAMAKAFHMTLAEAWDRVAVKEIGEDRSRAFLNENRYEAVHHQVSDHLFTLVNTGCDV
ncbi:MAG: polyketide synthase dehydratase domain-containing protein [Deltaproteobacteria bacterium]|nr:polyketide synthase dehydratase domain-containing protein [Deltaproteobacteria bacterium]